MGKVNAKMKKKSRYDIMAKAFTDACKKNGFKIIKDESGNLFAEDNTTGVEVISWIWNEECDDNGY